eukprot:gene3818-7604_t
MSFSVLNKRRRELIDSPYYTLRKHEVNANGNAEMTVESSSFPSPSHYVGVDDDEFNVDWRQLKSPRFSPLNQSFTLTNIHAVPHELIEIDRLEDSNMLLFDTTQKLEVGATQLGHSSLKNCINKGQYEVACRLIELGAEVLEEDEKALKDLIWIAIQQRGILSRRSNDYEV